MGSKIFSSGLSQSGIDKMIKELKHYRDFTLLRKMNEFADRLAEKGIEVAKVKLGKAEHRVTLKKELFPDLDGCKAIIYEIDTFPFSETWMQKDGTTKSAIASPSQIFEFGTGNKAVEGHQGTFPSDTASINANNPNGWSWQELDGTWHHCNGFKPPRPLYNATKEMFECAIDIAREVFSNE